MTSISQFAYAQARLHSRHGQSPGEQVWQQLHAVGELSNYLSVVRRTSLRPWVLGMNGAQSIHDIEQSLREQFRAYVGEVANWVPAEWQESVLWVGHLPDLPALLYLLKGQTAPAWIIKDPVLNKLASEQHERRAAALLQSDLAPMVKLWEDGYPISLAWLETWKKRLPDPVCPRWWRW